MRRSIQAVTLALLILGVTATQVRAGSSYSFDVTIPSSTTPGTLDFDITSNDSATLSYFGLGLTISPTGTSTSSAYFSTTQSDPYTNANYVFSGQSENSDLSLPFWTTTPSGALFPTSILGGDSNDGSGLGYVTLSSTAAYLGTVQFQVPSGADPNQVFQITLVGGSNTYFQDQNSNALSYTASLVGGAVVINVSASAVPEPSSLVLAAISSVSGLVVYRRRASRRKTIGS